MNQLINFFENSDSDNDSNIVEFLFSDSCDDEQARLVLNLNAIIEDDRSDSNEIPKIKNYGENIVNHLIAKYFKRHFRYVN